jgi:hypothetical protein
MSDLLAVRVLKVLRRRSSRTDEEIVVGWWRQCWLSLSRWNKSDQRRNRGLPKPLCSDNGSSVIQAKEAETRVQTQSILVRGME